jgi:glycosyltransferase involved in cell wall biosynthesis
LPLFIRLTYPLADEIIAVSKGAAEDLARIGKIPLERIRVLPNPVVSLDLLSEAEKSIDHPWFRSGSPPVVLSVGRLTHVKGYDILIHAFRKVRAHLPARLMILGEGPERSKLLRLIEKLCVRDDVLLPGFVKNPYQYMAQAGVFVLSSRAEALPTVLIEALACRVPIVSADCLSGPREILSNGDYGLLVPVCDPDALAEAILSTLNTRPPPVPTQAWKAFEIGTAVEEYLKMFGVKRNA